jgi:hypothetical protein
MSLFPLVRSAHRAGRGELREAALAERQPDDGPGQGSEQRSAGSAGGSQPFRERSGPRLGRHTELVQHLQAATQGAVCVDEVAVREVPGDEELVGVLRAVVGPQGTLSEGPGRRAVPPREQ